MGPDTQPEERVPPGVQQQNLDAALLQQAADILYRLVRFESKPLARNPCKGGRVTTGRGQPLDRERLGSIKNRLQRAVGVESRRNLGQDLLTGVNPLSRARKRTLAKRRTGVASLPMGTSSAFASASSVRACGSTSPRSILPTATLDNPALRASSAWVSSRSSRSRATFAAMHLSAMYAPP